jgi:diacylglycerol kinase family enzyme
VRALLIVNPRATSTTTAGLDFIVRALSARADLETVETRYRGHARDIAAAAVSQGVDAVLVLSGDGTINEVVNGLMQAAAPRPGDVPSAPAQRLPAIAALPGGNANVFIRALGVPGDLPAAVDYVGSRLATRATRTIGLGLAGDRYFTFNAGMGWDAEVVRAVEDRRAHGRRASSALYIWTALRQYYLATDRRQPSLTLKAGSGAAVDSLADAIITNTTPWTYVGRHPMSPTPDASFNTGLDLFGLRRLRTITTLNSLRQMARRSGRPPSGKDVVILHDEAELTIYSQRPVTLQVDGEYVGEPESVTFRSIPEALRVIA